MQRVKHGALLPVIALLVLCSGCLIDVQRRICSPGATGIVLDSRTHQPIANAQVAVAEYCPPSSESFDDPVTISNALRHTRRPRITTDSTGRFSIPTKSKTIVIIFFGDYFTPGGTLVVKRGGYQTKAIPVSLGDSLDTPTNPYGREVLLAPLPN